MFGACCHCHDQPANKDTQINYDPAPDKSFAADPSQQKAPPQSTPGPGGAPAKTEDPPLSQRSQSSLTPEEKAAEKQRLQELVKKFAKGAVQGVVCDMLDESGRLQPAKYSIDKQLKKMTVKGTSDAYSATHVFGLAVIQEIHRFEDAEPLFPPSVRGLSATEKERVLMVMYTNENGQAQKFCFFEQSAMDKERFLTCMKILRLYSQTSTPKSS